MSLFIRVALPGFRHQCKKWDCGREQRVTRFYSWFVSGSIEATDSTGNTGNTKGATIAQQNQTKFRRNAREKRDQKRERGEKKSNKKESKLLGGKCCPDKNVKKTDEVLMGHVHQTSGGLLNPLLEPFVTKWQWWERWLNAAFASDHYMKKKMLGSLITNEH